MKTTGEPKLSAKCWRGLPPRAKQLPHHDKPNIVDALGKDWFDVRRGKGRSSGQGSEYQLIARVQMEDWPKLAVSANWSISQIAGWAEG